MQLLLPYPFPVYYTSLSSNLLVAPCNEMSGLFCLWFSFKFRPIKSNSKRSRNIYGPTISQCNSGTNCFNIAAAVTYNSFKHLALPRPHWHCFCFCYFWHGKCPMFLPASSFPSSSRKTCSFLECCSHFCFPRAIFLLEFCCYPFSVCYLRSDSPLRYSPSIYDLMLVVSSRLYF